MNNQAPSIFNDVIGPVMRGPSSSHAAGAARIGELVRQAAGGKVQKVIVDFDPRGSLIETHNGQGSDMGLACGILGMSLTDPDVDRYNQLLQKSGIELTYRVVDFCAVHPNHYRIHLMDDTGLLTDIDAISTGGGMIELIALDDFPVSIKGDFDECCLIMEKEATSIDEKELYTKLVKLEHAQLVQKGNFCMIELKLSRALSEKEFEYLQGKYQPIKSYQFSPVLPTRSTASCRVPFQTAEEMLEYNENQNKELWELALQYESIRGSTPEEKVWEQMEKLADLMICSMQTGLAGTTYKDRILPAQAHQLDEKRNRLVPGTVMNTVIKYITAIMEAKSAMEVIVAAPTAGSCGCLPGTVLGTASALQLPREKVIQGFLAAGLVGVFFVSQATFAAEIGGCQVECGAGSGMAAAAVTQMMGGSVAECLDAASVALQGLTGLACDPVASRVEVPCLNKNIVGGMNALSSCNMILAGFDRVIPLDETIQAMLDIGQKLPPELRCTFGGLGKTKTALKIRQKLEAKEQ